MISITMQYNHPIPFDMARRCGYCGKFCHESRIHKGSGLCVDCKAEVGETADKGDNNMEVEVEEDSGPRRLSIDAPSDREPVHDTTATEAATETAAEHDSHSSNEEEPHDENSDKVSRALKTSEGKGKQLCGRCWINPATAILYGCPACNQCVDTAEKERVRFPQFFYFLLPSPTVVHTIFSLSN